MESSATFTYSAVFSKAALNIQFTENAPVALQQPILTHAHTKCPPVHLASFDLKKDNKDLQNLILETIKPKKADVSKVLNHLSTTCNSLSHLTGSFGISLLLMVSKKRSQTMEASRLPASQSHRFQHYWFARIQNTVIRQCHVFWQISWQIQPHLSWYIQWTEKQHLLTYFSRIQCGTKFCPQEKPICPKRKKLVPATQKISNLQKLICAKILCHMVFHSGSRLQSRLQDRGLLLFHS